MVVTVMILVDAFSIAYLNEETMPYIYNIGKEGLLTSLKPLFAFKGIETTLFTGKWPNEHGIFTEMRLRSTYTPIADRLFEYFIRLVDVSNHDKLMKLSRIVGECIFRGTRTRLTPNIIPPKMLKYFTASQHEPIYKTKMANIPTLFDRLRANNIKFKFIEPSILNGDEGTIKKIKRYMKNKEIGFWYIKFSGFDREGHIYGPEPLLFREKIIATERYIEEVINIFGGIDNINLLLVTDHGMSRVNNYIDLMSLNKLNNISLYKDYIVFLDSTLARFWFFNNYAKNKVVEYLNTLEFGHVVSDKEKNILKIPDNRTQTGDVMFVVDEGYVIYPDFWSGTRKPKGMHGYAYSNSKESLPIFITNKNMSHYYKSIPTYFTDIIGGVAASLELCM
ncbi:MAG: alkaline phosphatase family protein [Candidatus Nitrosocaldaceae archaeon]